MEGSSTDINILLDFITQPADENDCTAKITSLQTLSNMCESESLAQNLLQCGGIDIVKHLLLKSTNSSLQESCVYLLACASGSSQKVQYHLTNVDFFNFISKAISTRTTTRMKEMYFYLLLSLIASNKTGQSLLEQSKCLNQLLSIFLKGVHVITISERNMESNESLKLWDSATKVIIASLTQPQNKKNQNSCVQVFKCATTILHESKKHSLMIIQVCKLLSAAIFNNEYCQNMANMCRTVEVVILKLQNALSGNHLDKNLLTSILDLLINLIPENLKDCEKFHKLGGVKLLLRTLRHAKIDKSKECLTVLQQVIMLITKCASVSPNICKMLVSYNAPNLIVEIMNTNSTENSLNKLCTRLLHLCMNHQQKEGGVQMKQKGNDWDALLEESESDNSSVDGGNSQINAAHENDHMDSRSVISNQSVISTIIKKQSLQMKMLQELVLKERKLRQQTERKVDQLLEAQSNASYMAMQSFHQDFLENGRTSAKSSSSHLLQRKRGVHPTHNKLNNTMSCMEIDPPKYSELTQDFKIPYGFPRKVKSNFPNQQNILETDHVLTSTLLVPNRNDKNYSTLENECFTIPDDGLSEADESSMQQSNKATLDLSHITDVNTLSEEKITDNVSMINTSSKTMFTPKTACTIIGAIGNEKAASSSTTHNQECASLPATQQIEQPSTSQFIEPHITTAPTANNNVRRNICNDEGMKTVLPQDNKYNNFYNPRHGSKSASESEVRNIKKNNTKPNKKLKRRKNRVLPRQKSDIFGNNVRKQQDLNRTREIRLTTTPDARHNMQKKPQPTTRSISYRREQDRRKQKINIERLKSGRRKPIPFSQEEIMNLIKGVQLLGHQWRDILMTFNFHPLRTSVDIKDKYRNISGRSELTNKTKG